MYVLPQWLLIFSVVANMKWDGEGMIKVLEIAYTGVMRYSMWVLRDSTHSSNPLYMKKNAGKHHFLKLMEELLQRNVDFGDAETLRKNLISFKDADRSDKNKVS